MFEHRHKEMKHCAQCGVVQHRYHKYNTYKYYTYSVNIIVFYVSFFGYFATGDGVSQTRQVTVLPEAEANDSWAALTILCYDPYLGHTPNAGAESVFGYLQKGQQKQKSTYPKIQFLTSPTTLVISFERQVTYCVQLISAGTKDTIE